MTARLLKRKSIRKGEDYETVEAEREYAYKNKAPKTVAELAA